MREIDALICNGLGRLTQSLVLMFKKAYPVRSVVVKGDTKFAIFSTIFRRFNLVLTALNRVKLRITCKLHSFDEV